MNQMKIMRATLAVLAIQAGQGATLVAPEPSVPELNLELLDFNQTVLTPGDWLEFTIVSRIRGNGIAGASLDDFRYEIEFGDFGTLTFSDLSASGEVGSLSILGTQASVVFVDGLDADVAGLSDPNLSARLEADGDSLDFAIPNGEIGWDADWALRVSFQLPLDATEGSFVVEAAESASAFVNSGPSFGRIESSVPDATRNRFSPEIFVTVPEPSTWFFLAFASLFAASLRQRKVC